MHLENNASPFLLRKRPEFWTQMLLHTENNESLFLPKKKTTLFDANVTAQINITRLSLLKNKLKI